MDLEQLIVELLRYSYSLNCFKWWCSFIGLLVVFFLLTHSQHERWGGWWTIAMDGRQYSSRPCLLNCAFSFVKLLVESSVSFLLVFNETRRLTNKIQCSSVASKWWQKGKQWWRVVGVLFPVKHSKGSVQQCCVGGITQNINWWHFMSANIIIMTTLVHYRMKRVFLLFQDMLDFY